MALRDLFSRRRKPLDTDEAGISPIAPELDGNEAIRRKQMMLLGGVAGAGLLVSSFWIFGGDADPSKTTKEGADRVTVSTNDLVNRNLSDQEWMALSENRFQSTENQLRSINGQQQRVDQLAQQIEALRGQNQAMAEDGRRVLGAYQAENEDLRRQINTRAAAPPAPGPTAMYGPGGAPLYQRPDGTGAPGAAASAMARPSEVKLVSFAAGAGGTATRVERGNTVFTDSLNYLPPNSFASATRARSYSETARRLEELSQSLSRDASYAETHNMQLSENLSQDLAQWYRHEQARNPSLDVPDLWATDLSAHQRAVRQEMVSRWMADKREAIREEIADRLVEPSLGSVSGPGIGGPADVRASYRPSALPTPQDQGTESGPTPAIAKIEEGAAALEQERGAIAAGRTLHVQAGADTRQNVGEELNKDFFTDPNLRK